MEQTSGKKSLVSLPIEEWRILKVIEIFGGGDWPFIGYLAYLRPFQPKVNPSELDKLDVAILKKIKRDYTLSRVDKAVSIRFEGELKGYLKKYPLEKEELISINFIPSGLDYYVLSQIDWVDFRLGGKVAIKMGETYTKTFPVWHNATPRELSSFTYREIDLRVPRRDVKKLYDSIVPVSPELRN